MGTSSEADGHRSLADQLRSWGDDRLTRLLVARPDLSTPAPHDFGQLASRATVRVSLVRALDQLDRLELLTLDALVVLGPTPRPDLVAAVHAEASRVEHAVEHLLDLAVVWASPAGLRALGGVAEALALSAEPVTSGRSGSPSSNEMPASLSAVVIR